MTLTETNKHMKLEVGDMIVCARDYGIITKIESGRATLQWFAREAELPSRYSNTTGDYWVNTLESTIDGKHNKLVKGSR